MYQTPRKAVSFDEAPRNLTIEEMIERAVTRAFDKLNARVRELLDYDEASELLSMSKSSFIKNLIDTKRIIPVVSLDTKPRVRIDDLRMLIVQNQAS